MSELRRAVMDEMDDVHEMTNGSTPDHIIVSEAIWRDMKESGSFEVHGSPTEYRGNNKLGFMGMHAWQSAALDDRGKDALLLSEDVFQQLFDRAKSF